MAAQPHVTFDADCGAMYFYATDEPVARTVTVAEMVMVDLDADGGVVGVELAMDTRTLGRVALDAG